MPKEMEMELKARAKKMGMSKERTGAYVYGTMRKTGWTPSTQKDSLHSEIIKRAKKSFTKKHYA